MKIPAVHRQRPARAGESRVDGVTETNSPSGGGLETAIAGDADRGDRGDDADDRQANRFRRTIAGISLLQRRCVCRNPRDSRSLR